MAVSGEAGTEADAPSAEQVNVRRLDFSQPTKFTTDIRKHLTASLATFADSLSQELSNQLKAEVEISIGDVTQDMWAAARVRLATDALAVAVEEGPERALLLSVELPFLLQALECLLGGRAAQAPAERHLTDIDWTLAKGLLDTVVEGLSRAWIELDGPDLRRGELDLEGDAGVAAPASEPTLAVVLNSTVDGISSSMTLLMPWTAVEPIAETARGHGHHHVPPAEAGSNEGLRSGLAVAQVLLRAEVGTVQMPIERMLKIAPGGLVELEEAAAEGVVVYAEEVSVGRGKPGRSGTRKAIKLEVSDEPPKRADTYAKLGRAELERARAHAEASAGEDAQGILRNIFVRVWAELGRTHMSLGGALELTPGSVVELDQGAAEPVELFANGVCFASGSLVVTGEGSWAVKVEALV